MRDIRSVTSASTVFDQAAALFDDYRVHYGQASDLSRTRDWLAAQLSDGRLRMAVTLGDGRLTGLVTSALQPASLMLGSVSAVRDLFVKPDHRRSGIGRALLDHVIAEARAAGALRVALLTEPENAAALALYTAAGFRPVGGIVTLNLPLS